MPILKPVLYAALALAASALPAVAQPSPQGGEAPAAGPSAPAPDVGRGPDDRGWRGDPRDRYSDEDGPRWRQRDGGRRFGRDEDERSYHRHGGWGERRFGGEDRRFGGEDRRFGDGPRDRGMMPRFGAARLCGPGAQRFGDAMIARIERATQPTAEQRTAFDKLKEAAGKASDIMQGACVTDRPVTPTGRLAAAEKRLSAMLDAVRALRPAMDAYYGTLSDEQKARLALDQSRMGRGDMDHGDMNRGGMGERWRERGGEGWRGRRDRGDDRTENKPLPEPEKL